MTEPGRHRPHREKPTRARRKRVILDLLVIGFVLFLLVAARPLAGDPTPLLRKEHSLFGVIAFYVAAILVLVAALRDMYKILRKRS